MPYSAPGYVKTELVFIYFNWETYGIITGREEEKVVGNTQPQANRCDGGLGSVYCVIHGGKQALQGLRVLLETWPIDGMPRLPAVNGASCPLRRGSPSCQGNW